MIECQGPVLVCYVCAIWVHSELKPGVLCLDISNFPELPIGAITKLQLAIRS